MDATHKVVLLIPASGILAATKRLLSKILINKRVLVRRVTDLYPAMYLLSCHRIPYYKCCVQNLKAHHYPFVTVPATMPTNIIRKPVPGAAQSVSLLPPSREPEDTNSFPPTSPSRGYTSQDSVNHIPSLTAHEVPNPSSGQSWEGEVPVVSASSYQPINDNQERKPDLTKYVKWGVDWYKEPTYMVLLLLAGLAIALGHHFYYKNLNGATAEDESRQQWARAIGNGLSFLFVSALRGADGFAYSQYFWVLVRRRSFTLDGLDKLYSLTSDPTGLFSLKLFRNATIAMAVALVCWYILYLLFCRSSLP